MAVEVITNPQVAMLLCTLGSIFVGGIVALIYLLLKSSYGSSEGEAEEPYICGEPPTVVKSLTGPSEGMYWGFVKRVARSLYKYFRDLMHTGRLSDWAGYMSGWYGFLVITALILTMYVIVRGVMGGW